MSKKMLKLILNVASYGNEINKNFYLLIKMSEFRNIPCEEYYDEVIKNLDVCGRILLNMSIDGRLSIEENYEFITFIRGKIIDIMNKKEVYSYNRHIKNCLKSCHFIN